MSMPYLFIKNKILLPSIEEFSFAHIEKYLHDVKKEILTVTEKCRESIDALSEIVKQAKMHNKEVMFLGMQRDYYIISHACADFIKFNGVKAINMDVPEMTAFGNDYSYPFNFVESLKHRNYGDGNVLVGIQLGGKSKILFEALDYNFRHGGTNVLITNEPGYYDNVQTVIFISSKGTYISGDIVQLIFHYVSAHLAYDTNPFFGDEGAESLCTYCEFLISSLEKPSFSSKKLSKIASIIQQKLIEGNSVFAFGNGGSSAIASYFIEELREVCKGSYKAYRRIYDVASIKGVIASSIHMDRYKSDVFTRILDKFGVAEGDVLLGVSSSGNSENILHPFKNIPGSFRIGILGFQDGGKIGSSFMKDIAFIVPDFGGFNSYQRAEDGQRIALSSILHTFQMYGE